MSSTKVSVLPDLEIRNMDLQKACDLIEDMADMQRNNLPNMVVYSGHSEKFGLVHIILPTSGDPVMLPWLSDIFTTADQPPLNAL